MIRAEHTTATGARATVAWVRRESDGRNLYAWAIAADGVTVASGRDLRSGTGDRVDASRMLETLGAFLGAYAEALDYGPASENRDLFPATVTEDLATELHAEIASTLQDGNGDYRAPDALACDGCGSTLPRATGCRAVTGRCIGCGGDYVRRHVTATCGECDRSWCDGCDPTPSARCLYESDHGDDVEEYGRCVACGDPVDYCQGHGEIGDPAGAAILAAHDDDDHSGCHPAGCDAFAEEMAR